MRNHLLILALSASGALAACSGQSASNAQATPNEVTITAHDYSFDGPDSISAGVTTIKLVNQGTELHHLQLVRLEEGKTMQDLLAAFAAGGPPPSWASLVGGPNAVVPGKSNSVVQSLEPGHYGFLCVIPGLDGVPHVMKGMEASLTVTPATSTVQEPAPDAVMTLMDYGFQFSKPLTAGARIIRVENTAEQPHEVVLVRLKPGKTAAEMAAWEMSGRKGDAPGEWVGGLVGLTKGQHSSFAVNLETGTYGLICFFPDAQDGKPHLMHGMVQDIQVS
jgi:uncharacterized cupredoxin-like copper-binding protein